MNKKFILSTCGTSLLTNYAGDNITRGLIHEYANAKSKADVPESARAIITEVIEKLSRSVENAGYEQAAAMSAELNGIIKFYGGVLPKACDFHQLLSTDTWLGKETANLVKKWINRTAPDMIVDIYAPSDLQTKEMASFQWALSDLVKKFYEELPEFRRTGHKIVFNLTGGFKAVQGFLQSVANFFADETIYIFEKSEMLMRIPRLPVKLDAAGIVEKHLSCFRNLAMSVPYAGEIRIPETMFQELYGIVELSAWGEVLWNEAKEQLYRERLWPTPNPEKIRYGKGFQKSTESIEPDRMQQVNERIDQLNRHFQDEQYNPRSLDFKPLKGNRMAPSTHESDAWADKDAKRIFGHFESGCFVLDKLGKGLH